MDRVAELLEWPEGTRRLGVIACVGVLLVALAFQYPDALRDLDAEADKNAAHSYADREFAGGNSVVADQGGLYEARGRIPPDGSYAVSVGQPVEGWTDLTAPFIPSFARYFLLPRRQLEGAPWVLCYACDARNHPGYATVYTGSDGISLLHRSG